MNGDNGFGLFEPPAQFGVFAIDPGQFGGQRIFRRRGRPAFTRGQPVERAGVTLAASVDLSIFGGMTTRSFSYACKGKLQGVKSLTLIGAVGWP